MRYDVPNLRIRVIAYGSVEMYQKNGISHIPIKVLGVDFSSGSLDEETTRKYSEDIKSVGEIRWHGTLPIEKGDVFDCLFSLHIPNLKPDSLFFRELGFGLWPDSIQLYPRGRHADFLLEAAATGVLPEEDMLKYI